MSKRFGRNQKRRLRAEVETARANATAAVASAVSSRLFANAQAKQVAQLRHRLAYLLDTLDRLELTMLAPATANGRLSPWRWPVQTRRSFGAYYSPIGEQVENAVDLAEVGFFIERNEPALAHYVHFYVDSSRMDPRRWAYCVSDRALRYRLAPDVREHFARSIVQELLNTFDGDRRRSLPLPPGVSPPQQAGAGRG